MRRWQLWTVSGPVAGAATLGMLAPLLFLFDEIRVSASLDTSVLGVAAVAAMIAGVYGALGGGIVGAIGGFTVAWLDRRRAERSWTVDVRIASATAGLVSVAMASVNVFDGTGVGPWDVVIWIVAPTLVTAAVAGAVAAAIFGVCGPGSAAPSRRART